MCTVYILCMYIYIYVCVGQYYLLPAKNVYNLGGPLSVFRFQHLFACIWVVPYRSQLFVYIYLFGVSVLGGPSPMLEGIGFGWAPIDVAMFCSQITFSKKHQKTMSGQRLLLTYSNSVGYYVMCFLFDA